MIDIEIGLNKKKNYSEISDMIKEIDFCIYKLQKAQNLKNNIFLDTEIVENLTVSKIIKTIVICRQEIDKIYREALDQINYIN